MMLTHLFHENFDGLLIAGWKVVRGLGSGDTDSCFVVRTCCMTKLHLLHRCTIEILGLISEGAYRPESALQFSIFR